MCCRRQVTRAKSPQLSELWLPGALSVWESLGFDLRGNGFVIGEVACSVGEPAASWSFRGVHGEAATVGAIETRRSAASPASPAVAAHPNGATKIDHVVVVSGAPARTTEQLESLGLVGKGLRTLGSGVASQSQSFFWTGDVLIELVGPTTVAGQDRDDAFIWGITFVVPDFDRLNDVAGELLSQPKQAVQEGRRIITVTGDNPPGLKIAFMTPHIRASGG